MSHDTAFMVDVIRRARNSFNLLRLREVFSMFPRNADVVVGYEASGPHAYTFQSEAMPGYTAVFTPVRG